MARSLYSVCTQPVAIYPRRQLVYNVPNQVLALDLTRRYLPAARRV